MPFRRGEKLLAAGANSRDVLLVESGLVKVTLHDITGAKTVAGLFGMGELLGELGVIWQRSRSADVIALTSGGVVRVSSPTFLRLRRESSDVRELLDATWRRRQEDADDRQLAQAKEVPTRVVLSLLKWAERFGLQTDEGVVLRGLTQRELAQAVCASAKSVEAVLRELRAAGLVVTGRRTYRIPSLLRLEGSLHDSG